MKSGYFLSLFMWLMWLLWPRTCKCWSHMTLQIILDSGSQTGPGLRVSGGEVLCMTQPAGPVLHYRRMYSINSWPGRCNGCDGGVNGLDTSATDAHQPARQQHTAEQQQQQLHLLPTRLLQIQYDILYCPLGEVFFFFFSWAQCCRNNQHNTISPVFIRIIPPETTSSVQ